MHLVALFFAKNATAHNHKNMLEIGRLTFFLCFSIIQQLQLSIECCDHLLPKANTSNNCVGLPVCLDFMAKERQLLLIILRCAINQPCNNVFGEPVQREADRQLGCTDNKQHGCCRKKTYRKPIVNSSLKKIKG